jgi:hypothetical protein
MNSQLPVRRSQAKVDQLFLSLSHIVTHERSISLVCIPDRDTAECELTRLRSQHGPNLLRATIRKDRPSVRVRHSQLSTQNSQLRSTYTLRYTILVHEPHRLF